MSDSNIIPKWLSVGVIPLMNLFLAFCVSGLFIFFIGENPFRAISVMIKGAFYYPGAIGYTLYYTTNFIFTGLAVALAFHARLFNIGGEGQAYVGGLGVGLVCLIFDQHVVGFLVTILAILGSVIFGAIWGIIPGYLQAKRGSHIVITTIMFNFIAAALMVYLLVNVIIEPGQMSPETRDFASGVGLVQIHILAKYLGLDMAMSPLNLSFIVALTVSVGFWFLVWRTKFGYEVRSLGHSETAAIYAGIKVSSTIIIVMASFGMMLIIRSLVQVIWGPNQITFVKGIAKPNALLKDVSDSMDIMLLVPSKHLFIILGTVIIMLAFNYMLTRTRIGKAMRAVSDSPDLAKVTGIDVELVIRATWIVGGFCAVMAGVFMAMDTQFIMSTMGFRMLLPMFAAAIYEFRF